MPTSSAPTTKTAVILTAVVALALLALMKKKEPKPTPSPVKEALSMEDMKFNRQERCDSLKIFGQCKDPSCPYYH